MKAKKSKRKAVSVLNNKTVQLIGALALGALAYRTLLQIKWKTAQMYVAPDYSQVIVAPKGKHGMTAGFSSIIFYTDKPQIEENGSYYPNSGVKL